jgi:hypothetical protein
MEKIIHSVASPTQRRLFDWKEVYSTPAKKSDYPYRRRIVEDPLSWPTVA